jgi:hypothetical protein
VASRRNYDSLSDAYRKRLERGGISRTEYNRGDSLKAARGHKAGVTPEHPSDVRKSPKTYEKYITNRTERLEKQRQRESINPDEYNTLIEKALRNAVKILESGNVNFRRDIIRQNLRKLTVAELKKAATIDAQTWHRNATTGKSAGAYWYGKKSTTGGKL